MSTDTGAAATATVGLARAEKGLASARMTAYNTHGNLVIRADDVWLTTLAQFFAYVNKNVRRDYETGSSTTRAKRSS